MTTFNSNAGGLIPLDDAVALTQKFREDYPDAIKAHYFSKSVINDVLLQSEAVGIRIYNGIDNDGARQLILVAVDIDGNDLYEGNLADMSTPCPLICDENSPLCVTK